MPKYLIEGSEDGGLFAETIEALTQEDAIDAAIDRLCEAWGYTREDDTTLDDLGDAASVTEYGPDDYARDAAPAMLAALRALVAANNGEPSGVTVPMLDAARAAIAAATPAA